MSLIALNGVKMQHIIPCLHTYCLCLCSHCLQWDNVWITQRAQCRLHDRCRWCGISDLNQFGVYKFVKHSLIQHQTVVQHTLIVHMHSVRRLVTQAITKTRTTVVASSYLTLFLQRRSRAMNQWRQFRQTAERHQDLRRSRPTHYWSLHYHRLLQATHTGKMAKHRIYSFLAKTS